jgi:iron complex outermembrane recepter protein
VRVSKIAFVSSLSALALTAGSSALAQTAPATTPAQPAATDGGVTDIVVTAQRRTERLQDVPVSVTALNASALKDRGMNDATQMVLGTPSLQIGSNDSFAIRGIGTLAFAGTIDSSVATSEDDINIGRPLAATPTFYDIAQVEVLNGPQGLLFGKNASAGLINIHTNDPKLGQLSGAVDVEGDNRPRPGSDGYGAIVRADINVPVSQNSALRVAGFYNYQDALTQHVGGVGARYDGNVSQYGVRAKYLWEPSAALKVLVQGDYNESHGISSFLDTTYRSLATDSVDADALAADHVTPGAKNLTYDSDSPNFRDLKNGGAQARAVYRFDNGMELSDIAAWRFYSLNQNADGDATGQNAANVNYTNSRYDQFSDELRLALPSGSRLSGQGGLYYFHSRLREYFNIAGNDFVPTVALPAFCVGVDVSASCPTSYDYFLGEDKNYQLDTDSLAAFGQLTYAVTDKLKLIGGGRVTHDRISITDAQNQLTYFVPLAVTANYDQEYSHTDFSWKLGGQYNFTRNVMAYVTVARGYKGPGFNDTGATTTANLTILPETSHSVELGVKSSFFDHHLVFDVAAFHTSFDNYQSQSFDSSLRTFVISNAARLVSKGVEVNLTAKPVTGVTIDGGATFLRSKFGSFPGVECYPGQGGCSADSTFDAAGLTSPDAPNFTSTIQVRYDHALTGGLRGYVSGNWYHRSSINYLVNQAPGAEIGAIDLFGANIGIKADRWNAAVFCKNCTNKVNPTYIGLESGDQAAGKASYTQQFGWDSVRTIGVQFGYHF